jgi:hypothetical protein
VTLPAVVVGKRSVVVRVDALGDAARRVVIAKGGFAVGVDGLGDIAVVVAIAT